MNKQQIERLRGEFHQELVARVLTVDANGIASNADKSNALSVEIAGRLAHRVKVFEGRDLPGQTKGRQFELLTASYLEKALEKVHHPMFGTNLMVSKLGDGAAQISGFRQYEHLQRLQKLFEANVDLMAVANPIYDIKPDIVLYYNTSHLSAIGDEHLESVEATSYTRGTEKNPEVLPLLHAVVSCKWTIRSDRVQNVRAEANTLIRSRKGHTPHIAVLIGEPLPSRIASVALGTGEIDCVYHFALDELMDSVQEARDADANMHLMRAMIDGGRLKDIRELPYDLIE